MKGVLHVGGHDGREIVEYRTSGAERIVVVEPLPHRAAHLRTIGVEVVEAAIASQPGARTLYVTDRDEGSSLLQPLMTYRTVDTIEVETLRLDDLDLTGVDWLVVDVQGAELDVLSSGPLDQFSTVVVEASRTVRYEGGATEDDIVGFMEAAGFTLTGRVDHPTNPGVADLVWTL